MSQTAESEANIEPVSQRLRDVAGRYEHPDNKRAIWQLINTLVPYVGLWVAMYFTWDISIPLTLGLATIAAGLLVRSFILFHDCGHGSFFTNRKANTLVGVMLGSLVFVSYHHWSWEHWRHHATAGDLDRRGIGDVWTLTVEEYMNASWLTRARYRLLRHPLLMFSLGPPFMFLVWQRFANSKASAKAKRSVRRLNLFLLVAVAGMIWIYGLVPYLVIQFTVIAIAGTIGIWMFYVQHQFEGVYWQRNDDWDPALAALRGSSFFKLPAILRWFTGNIGYHHVHHLGPRVPNYHLKACHESHPAFSEVPTLTLTNCLSCCRLRLYDEEKEQLIGLRRAIREYHQAKERGGQQA